MKKAIFWIFIVGFPIILWSIICDPAPTSVGIETQAKPAFAMLPGALGITLFDSKRERSSFTVRQGKLTSSDPLPPARPAASSARDPEVLHRFLPEVDGYRAEGPFAYDPTGRFVAAALSPSRTTSNTALRVVNVELGTNRFVYDDNRPWVVAALAWAPDSSRVALIRSESNRRYCFGDVLRSASGHPAFLETFHLSVLDMSGRVVAETIVIDHVADYSVELLWME